MTVLNRLVAALLLAALPFPATAATSVAQLESLRAADLRLATIGWRLQVANLALCDRSAPAPGLVIHAIDAYAPEDAAAVRAAFAFAAPVSVEAVVPGSPADRAGVRANDGVAAVGLRPLALAQGAKPPTVASRDAALAVLAVQPDAPLRLTLIRGDGRHDVTVPAFPGCRARFELLLGQGADASSDGERVLIGARYLERFDDPALAAIVAHELAHIILHHRERLDRAGVSSGALREFGRSGRLTRLTEDQADRLSVALLYNAGFDPLSAARLWREHPDLAGGLFRARTHASAKARAAALAATAAAIPSRAPRPWVPPILATRDAALQ